MSEQRMTDAQLVDAIEYRQESYFWPLDDVGEAGSVVDVLVDLQSTRARLAVVRQRIAAEIDERCETVYPRDVFIPVTPKDALAYHAMFEAAGLSVDKWSAHVMRFGYASISAFVRSGNDDG